MVQWNIVISCGVTAGIYQAYGLLWTEEVEWYLRRHLQSIVFSKIACSSISFYSCLKPSHH